MEKNITLKNIFGNSMWQIGEKIISMIFSVFVTSIVARYLGTEDYGFVNYIISIVMLFTTFSTLGMEKITIKDIIEKEESEEKILGTSFYIRLIGGIVLIFISQITIYILDEQNMIAQLLGLIMGLCMIFRAYEVIEYYLQSQMKLKTISIIRFCSTILVAILRILVVLFDWGIVGFTATYLFDAIIVAMLLKIWYKKRKKLKFKFSLEYAKRILSKCWYVPIIGLMVTLYMRIDQVMLGSMLDNKTENGIYSAAVRIAEIWYFVPTAIISAFQPAIVMKKKYSEEQYEKSMQRLYDIVAIVGIVFGILITLFGDIAVQILYGEEYKGATSILKISVWAGLFATLGTARSVWLVNENLQKYSLIYTSVGCVTNIVLNYFLIPKIGARGAAFATLIAQFVTNVLALVPFKKTRKSSAMILKSIFLNQTVKDVIKTFRIRINNLFFREQGRS